MIIRSKIITNNILSHDKLKDDFDIDFVEGTMLDVMITVRDYLHKGYRLLTHPLMGSVKPNETPYKSVAISLKPENGTDYDSIMLIENSIETVQRFLSIKPLRNWPQSVLEDFSVIDYDLIKNALIK